MIVAWVPHISDVLPYFRMDPDERCNHLRGFFGEDSNGTFVFERGDDGIRTAFRLCCTDAEQSFRAGLTVSYDGSPEVTAEVVLESDGVMSIEIPGTVADPVARAISKDIAALFRQCFCPLSDVTDTFGRDAFSISDSPSRPEALSDLVGSMIRVSEDKVGSIRDLVSDRLESRYDESFRVMDAGSAEGMQGASPTVDSLKAGRALLVINSDRDAVIERTWSAVRLYIELCRNLMFLSGQPSRMERAMDNIGRYADELHRIVNRRHEADREMFELDAALAFADLESTLRDQARSMDFLSRTVAVLTGITTTLAVSDFLTGAMDHTAVLLYAGAVGAATWLAFKYSVFVPRRPAGAHA